MKCNSGVASRGTMFKSREIKVIGKERHKYNDIRLCFSIKCSKKSWALKCKQEVGRQQSSLTLAVDGSEWTAVYPHKQHLCTNNRMLGHPQLVWTLQEDKNFWFLPGIKPQFLSPNTSNCYYTTERHIPEDWT